MQMDAGGANHCPLLAFPYAPRQPDEARNRSISEACEACSTRIWSFMAILISGNVRAIFSSCTDVFENCGNPVQPLVQHF